MLGDVLGDGLGPPSPPAAGPTSAVVSGSRLGPLAANWSAPTSKVPPRFWPSMSRVTWGNEPSAAPIAGLPLDSR